MSDDVQVVASNDVAPNLPVVAEAEADANQDIAEVTDEEQDDASPDDASLSGTSLDNAELADEVEADGNAAPVAPPAQPETPVEGPYDFDRCTIQIGLQLLPDDGDPAGRPVVVGVRNHADAPIVRMLRLSEQGALPLAITGLLDQLRAEMPARQKAREEALAKKKAEEEAAKAKRAAAKARSGKKEKSATPKPKKHDLSLAPDSAPAPVPAKPSAVPAPASPDPAGTLRAVAQSDQLSML